MTAPLRVDFHDDTFHSIYELVDPRTGEVRYIGRAKEPRKRLRAHITQSKKLDHHKDRWIRELAAEGLEPFLRVVDRCSQDDIYTLEQHYILEYREAGHRLTNLSDGGWGTMGLPMSDETKAKIGRGVAIANRGNRYAAGVRTPEQRARMSPKNPARYWAGKTLSVEHKEKMAESHRGKKRSPEAVEASAAGHRGMTYSKRKR